MGCTSGKLYIHNVYLAMVPGWLDEPVMQDNQSSILILAAKSYLSFIALLLFDKIDLKN